MTGQIDADAKARIEAILRDSRHDTILGKALIIAAVFLALTLCDFLIVPVMLGNASPSLAREILVFTLWGVIAGQACLLSICSTMGPGRLVYRRSMEAAVGMFWLSALAAGYGTWLILDRSPSFYFLTAGEAGVALFVPAIYVGVQVPAWTMTAFFHWRIERHPPVARRAPIRRLTVADLLISIAAVAVALACARAAFYIFGFEPGKWIALGVVILIAAGTSLASSLPAAVLVLGLKSFGLGLGLLGAYSVAALTVSCVVTAMLAGHMRNEVFLWVPLFAGFVLALAGPLCLARVLGFRLRWGREMHAPSTVAPLPINNV